MISHKKYLSSRSKRGIMSAMLFAIVLLSSFAIGALALDVAHAVMIRYQLQVATEAGALAGAQELAKNTITSADVDNAQNYAANVTAANKADNTAVSNANSAMTVSVSVDQTNRTVTVTATDQTTNIFARIFGNNSQPVSAQAVAQASNGIQVLYPGQALPLAVSLDTVPSKGPQKDKPLNSYIGSGSTDPFTLVLNPQNSKNACWLTDWTYIANSPSLTFGATQSDTQNGVVASDVNNIQPGQTLMLPIIQGDPPMNDMRTIIGIIPFTVTSKNWPQQITGTLSTPVFLNGKPGQPILSTTTSQDNQFLSQWAPWKVGILQ